MRVSGGRRRLSERMMSGDGGGEGRRVRGRGLSGRSGTRVRGGGSDGEHGRAQGRGGCSSGRFLVLSLGFLFRFERFLSSLSVPIR